MSEQEMSAQAQAIAKLLDSLNLQKADLSYRMEGMLQVISIIASTLSDIDRKNIVASILRATETFGQYDPKSGQTINRYALQTLQHLKV